MALKLITPPAVEPVSLNEVRLFLRIDSAPGEEDELIETLITTARAEAETRTSRQLITATWELYLDSFFPKPQDAFKEGLLQIPLPPLQSIGGNEDTFIKYLNTAGVEKTLAASAYRVDAISIPGRVTPAYGYSWPDTYPATNAVVIRFKAGYGNTAVAVPQKIRNWIMTMVGSMWENRETVIISPSTSAQVQVEFLDGLLDDFRWSF